MEKIKARDLMHKQILSVRYETTVQELVDLLVEHNISGVPVLDPEGNPVGVVTEKDILIHAQASDRGLVIDRDYYHQLDLNDIHLGKGFQLEEGDVTPVGDIMTPRVVCVDEEASVRLIAQAMVRERVHRVFVLSHGKLAGVVSTMDLLEVIAQ